LPFTRRLLSNEVATEFTYEGALVRYFFKRSFFLVFLCLQTVGHCGFYRLYIPEGTERPRTGISFKTQKYITELLRKTHGSTLLSLLRSSGVQVVKFSSCEEVIANSDQVEAVFSQRLHAFSLLRDAVKETTATVFLSMQALETTLKTCLSKQQEMYDDRIQDLLKVIPTGSPIMKKLLPYLAQQKADHNRFFSREKAIRSSRAFYRKDAFDPFHRSTQTLEAVLDVRTSLRGLSSIPVFLTEEGPVESTISPEELQFLTETLRGEKYIFSLLDFAGKTLHYLSFLPRSDHPLSRNISLHHRILSLQKARYRMLYELEQLYDIARVEAHAFKVDFSHLTKHSRLHFTAMLEKISQLRQSQTETPSPESQLCSFSEEKTEDEASLQERERRFQEKQQAYATYQQEKYRHVCCFLNSQKLGFSIVESWVLAFTDDIQKQIYQSDAPVQVGLHHTGKYLVRWKNKVPPAGLPPMLVDKAADFLAKASPSCVKALLLSTFREVVDYREVEDFIRKEESLRERQLQARREIPILVQKAASQFATAKSVDGEMASLNRRESTAEDTVRKLENREFQLYSLHTLACATAISISDEKLEKVFRSFSKKKEKREKAFEAQLAEQERKMQFVDREIISRKKQRYEQYASIQDALTTLEYDFIKANSALHGRPTTFATPQTKERCYDVVTVTPPAGVCYDLLDFQEQAVMSILENAGPEDIYAILDRAGITVKRLSFGETFLCQNHLQLEAEKTQACLHSIRRTLEQLNRTVASYRRFLDIHRPRVSKDRCVLFEERQKTVVKAVRSLEKASGFSMSPSIHHTSQLAKPMGPAEKSLRELEMAGLADLTSHVDKLLALYSP